MSETGLLQYIEHNCDRLSPLLILTHDYPDPDALASAYALLYLADHLFGITCRIVYGGVIGRSENREMVRLLKIPAHKLRPSDFLRFPNVALVDTQPSFENNMFFRSRKAAIVIDQHPSTEPPNADFVWINTEAGATSALLGGALLASGAEVPSRLATALVYGILSDTLDFYRSANKDTIDIYLRLLHRADVRVLAQIQNPQRPKKFFGDLAAALQKASLGGRLIVSHLGPVESPDIVSQMADFFLSCEGVQWAFCTGRYRGNLHMSLRTNLPEGQAGDVLRSICRHPREAGGHGQIAGGKIRVSDQPDGGASEDLESTLTHLLIKRLGIKQHVQMVRLIEQGHSIRVLAKESADARIP